MKRLLSFKFFAFLLLVLLLPSMALAAAQKAMILPFAVNAPQGYKYLEKSIPQMFATRLHWPDHVDAVLPESEKLNVVPENESQVRSIIKDNKLDYAVWGSLTVVGEDCSLDVRVLDKEGKLWTKSRENRVDQLIPVLTSVSDSMNDEVFKRTAQMAQTTSMPKASVVAAPVTTQAPTTLHTPDTGGIVVVPPAVKGGGEAKGGDEAKVTAGGLKMMENKGDDRFVSQQLNVAAVGMTVCDADGDGRSEIFLFDDHNLYAYFYENGRVIGTHKIQVSRILYNIALTSYDFGPGIGRKLILSTVDMENEPRSFVISYKNRKLTTDISDIRFYLNVIKDQDGKAKLIGQFSDRYDMFRKNGAFEAQLQNGKLVQGKAFNLAPNMNIYNFVYLPGKAGTNDPNRIVRISNLEKLETYSLGGTKLYESSEDFSGGQGGIVINNTVLGSGDITETEPAYYYLPLHMPVNDLDGDGRYEVIVNRPVTTFGTFFSRYRSFVESEVACMYWDGIGLTPQWKTPILGGSVCGVALADLDGNGVLDLVLCLNAANSNVMLRQKAVIVAFPLHFAKASATE